MCEAHCLDCDFRELRSLFNKVKVVDHMARNSIYDQCPFCKSLNVDVISESGRALEEYDA